MTQTPENKTPSPNTPPPTSHIHGIQRITVWLVAIIAFFAVIIMTINVVMYKAPGGRNVLNDTNVQGKQPLLLDPPQWQLTDAFGNSVSNETYKGKVVIYDFIFTQCALVCPIMSIQMADVQNTLKGTPAYDQINIVSMSIDGKNDTPEVLKRYGYDPDTGAGADPNVWHFVTGDQKTVWPIVEQQFKLPLEQQPEVEGMPIAHSSKFVLVDKQGRIYNYYDLNFSEDRSALLADIQRLVRE